MKPNGLSLHDHLFFDGHIHSAGQNDGLRLHTNMDIVLLDAFGNVKEERHVHNLVTTAGKAGVMDQVLAAPSLIKMGWMAIGTSTPAATLLGAEVARVAFDSKTRSGAIITAVATFPGGTGTGAITEAGTFDVVTANTVNMWMSGTFAVINKGASDPMIITWTLTAS